MGKENGQFVKHRELGGLLIGAALIGALFGYKFGQSSMSYNNMTVKNSICVDANGHQAECPCEETNRFNECH